MPIYFAGFTSSALFPQKRGNKSSQEISWFTEIAFPELIDIEIGHAFLLLWHKSQDLLISPDPIAWHDDPFVVVELPDSPKDERCKFAVPNQDKRRISILSTNNVFWEYDMLANIWKMSNTFIPNMCEHAVKIIDCGYTLLLTNLGRLINMYDHLAITKDNVKFIDMASGVQRAILLGDDNNVYSISVRMCELEDGSTEPDGIIGPDLIPELQGLNIVQVAAAAWHSAAITDQGQLYTWGFNARGELGHINNVGDIQYIPQLVSFAYNDNNIGVRIKKVQCGECFTICLADDGTLWGSGLNVNSEFGIPATFLQYSPRFFKLDLRMLGGRAVKDLKCSESGTAIFTE